MDRRQLEWKAELAELLLHAAREFGETLEPKRVYERFHELLADAVPHDGLIVSSYDERDDLIRAEYAWSDGAVLDASKPSASGPQRPPSARATSPRGGGGRDRRD